uniref:Uncharacterized protein n=1 Tax=Nymphaea colorata TaxID=210225 RepID=A0A5K1A8S4_9MAGN
MLIAEKMNGELQTSAVFHAVET